MPSSPVLLTTIFCNFSFQEDGNNIFPPEMSVKFSRKLGYHISIFGAMGVRNFSYKILIGTPDGKLLLGKSGIR